MVAERVFECDCCTRVLTRSAGWRRTAERTPELRPAKKWKEDDEREVEPFDISALSMLRNATVSGRNERLAWC
jgi:hypothetical protein